MDKTQNGKALGYMETASWNQPMVKSKRPRKFAMFFTLRESRGYPISGACPPLAGCQV